MNIFEQLPCLGLSLSDSQMLQVLPVWSCLQAARSTLGMRRLLQGDKVVQEVAAGEDVCGELADVGVLAQDPEQLPLPALLSAGRYS